MPELTAAVLGAGAWGTTFAKILADSGANVRLWTLHEDVVAEINEQGTNTGFIPGLHLPAAVRAGTDPGSVLDGAQLVAVVLPSQAARAALEPLVGLVAAEARVVSLMKGIEQHTDALMSEVVAQALELDDDTVAVLSGPNLAPEIAAEQPTATVVAARDQSVAEWIAARVQTSYFRPYTNSDVIGVELCGAVKNVIALGSGIAQGLGYGHNTIASIVTRGLLEITRLGLALGARPETFSGLAGMGDLMATCASPLSRNNSIGMRLGRGMGLAEAIEATGGTAEGVWTAPAVLDLAQSLDLDAPITAAVVEVLYGGVPPRDVQDLLLARPRKVEGLEGARGFEPLSPRG